MSMCTILDLLHRFVIGLRDSYHRSNPYHNFAHAVDVLQATFYFLCRMGKLPQSGYGFPPLPEANGDAIGSDNHTNSSPILTPTEESDQSESLANIPTDDHPSPLAEEEIVQPPVRIQDFLRPEDIFALVVASIGHDVGHPGVNNMFLVRKSRRKKKPGWTIQTICGFFFHLTQGTTRSNLLRLLSGIMASRSMPIRPWHRFTTTALSLKAFIQWPSSRL